MTEYNITDVFSRQPDPFAEERKRARQRASQEGVSQNLTTEENRNGSKEDGQSSSIPRSRTQAQEGRS